jgi:hypothetical protein
MRGQGRGRGEGGHYGHSSSSYHFHCVLGRAVVPQLVLKQRDSVAPQDGVRPPQLLQVNALGRLLLGHRVA